MKLYVQLMILFVISLIGEGISKFLSFAYPRQYYRLDYSLSSPTIQVAENQTCQYGGEFLAGQYDHSLFATSSGNHGEV